MQAKSITIRVSQPEFMALAAQADAARTTITAFCTSIIRDRLQAKQEEARIEAMEGRILAALSATKEQLAAEINALTVEA